MALLEDTIGGWSGSLAVGLGAILVLPVVVPVLGSIARPVIRTVVGGALAIVDGVTEVISTGYDQVSSLVGEARAEISVSRPAR